MRRKALLVGINRFKENINPLNGCINDVLDMRVVLKLYFGMANTDIHCLTGERATQTMVLARMKMLSDWAMPGDGVIFLFSSHGSQIRDRHGDELSDHMDELVCTYDMNWERQIYLLDDTLGEAVSLFRKGVLFESFLDTCHSGTGFRNPGANMDCYRIKSKFVEPPIDIQMRHEGEESELKPIRKLMQAPSPSTKALWAACKSNQTSADAYFNGRYNGAFTYTLVSMLKKNKGKVTRRALLTQIRKSLGSAGFDQIPQLEADKATYDKNIFTL